MERAQTQEDGDVKVTVAVLDAKESAKVFGTPLAKKGIQPVWIEIENFNSEPFIFLQRSVDPDYYAPQEAATISRRRMGKTLIGYGLVAIIFFPILLGLPVKYFQARSINKKMELDFEEKGLHNNMILPKHKISGFVFTPLDEGTKKVQVELFGEGAQEKKFVFYIEVPGLKQDFKKGEFDSRFTDSELVHYTKDEFEKKLEGLPCCTTNKKGTKSGDPLNLIIVAELREILNSFALAKWDETEELTLSTTGKMLKAFVTGKNYRYSPVSPLYYQGHKHDIALQKNRDNIHERLHLRLWYTRMRIDGEPVWVGQVSRDIGIRFTTKAWNLMTHKIDANIDESREYVFADLVTVERVAYFGYVNGVGKSTRRNPQKNLTGDPYFSDGLRLVMQLSFGRTRPVFLDWEFPGFNNGSRQTAIQPKPEAAVVAA